MSTAAAEREELFRITKNLPDDQVPVVLDFMRNIQNNILLDREIAEFHSIGRPLSGAEKELWLTTVS
jgi:hypothetical protein